jgi:DNA-directed RNA polymerase specialized sigma24 family protein
MPIKPPPPTGPASNGMSLEGFSSVSRHAKETIRRLRAYLGGRRAVELESLVTETKVLTTEEWCAALPEPRERNGKLTYIGRASLEQFSDAREDPFETVYGRELISRLEAMLPPEQVPYLDAFLAGERPKDVAKRLGISAKAASARMRRFKAKLADLYATLRQE